MLASQLGPSMSVTFYGSILWVIFHMPAKDSLFPLTRLTVAWLKVMWKQLLMNALADNVNYFSIWVGSWRLYAIQIGGILWIHYEHLLLLLMHSWDCRWNEMCCVYVYVWTLSNCLDKIIPGILRLNLSQKLHMAAPQYIFPLVNVFSGVVLNHLFFFVNVEVMHKMVSPGYVRYFRNELLASYYHLHFISLGC